MSTTEFAVPQQSIEGMYTDHGGWLKGWLRRKLGDSCSAADLAHDTFVRLLAKDALPEIREPRALLTTIAQGLVLNLRRRQRLEQAYLEALARLPEPQAPSPETRVILLETLLEIDRLLDGLPRAVRQAFLLSQLEGRRQADIAVELGLSVPTVKRYVARALAQCCFALRRRVPPRLRDAAPNMDLSAPIAPEVRHQAAQWLVELQADDVDDDTRRRWQAWRQADPEHERAWLRVESFRARLQALPGPLATAALAVPASGGRRRLVKALALAIFAGGGASVLDEQRTWRRWTADSRTGTGERAERLLPDGTRVTLNAGTAIDLRYSASERVLRLVSGEILVTTAPDPQGQGARPFIVQTGQGRLRALGTRFSVRDLDGRGGATARIAVFEGAVEMTPAHGGVPVILHAGQQGTLMRDQARVSGPVGEDAAAWTQGMIVAQDMPLPAFLAELGRYRPGRLDWDEGVAHLTVTGTYPTANTDRVLEILLYTLPIELSYLTRYWVTVKPGAGGDHGGG
ncbi:sigma-70 family RNA polymerase sigma factor [Achromobacter sp. Marseille-Q0513]|uniref:sigma-70 family RNA polymerase sigma factor n=1 Tax=Achromobacter sp. Marseille-Q0513 TaxID=2829161 RepID=UPI0032C3FC98